MANEDNIIIENIKTIARIRGVKFDYVIDSLTEAIKAGVKRRFGKGVEPEVSVNKSTGEIRINLVKKVVEKVNEPDKEISLEDAQKIKECSIGDVIRIPIPIGELGRTAIESVKQALTQRISEAERNRIMAEYEKKVGEIVKGIVKVVTRNEVLVDLGPIEASIPSSGMMKSEHYRLDAPIRAVVFKVERAQWGPKIILSRTDPKFLERLLYYEIPEIKDGTIQIVKIVREPGVRAKVAVQTLDPKIDPIGACVGYKGSRIQSIVKELSDEKIDVIQWTKDINLLVSRSLSPAKVKEVKPLAEGNVLAIVPDEDYSKAIGKNGVNVELASNLTGVHIEIKKISEYEKELEEKKLKETKIEDVPQLDKTMKKILIEKGYTDVLSVLKATPDELKTLLALDDTSINELYEKLRPKKEEKSEEKNKEKEDASESS
ncbi:MAG: transcription termination factor NusA [candidate division WOR-3 bacterium]